MKLRAGDIMLRVSDDDPVMKDFTMAGRIVVLEIIAQNNSNCPWNIISVTSERPSAFSPIENPQLYINLINKNLLDKEYWEKLLLLIKSQDQEIVRFAVDILKNYKNETNLDAKLAR